MPQFNLKPEWESLKSSSRAVGVDRVNGILRGFVVAQKGPFKSDGRGEFDDDSLDSIVKLMNENQGGTKSRFTHPDMSNDGLGKFLGRAKDPAIGTAIDERTGKKVKAVRADLHFDKTALETPIEGGKPLGVYIMDLAESDPDAVSSSLVLRVDQAYRLETDGTRTKDKEGNPLPPLWRPKKIHASDIVDTGDAVDGLLSAGIDVDALPLAALWRGAELLDSVFAGQPVEVIRERCSAWLERYLSSKFGGLDMGQLADEIRSGITVKADGDKVIVGSNDKLRRRLRLRELEIAT